MSKTSLKIFCVFFALTFMLLAMPCAMGAGSRNIYEGISAADFDEISTSKYQKQANGAIDISEKGAVVSYKNIDFYKDTSHIRITYATGTFVNPRKVKFMLDNPDTGTEIAYLTLEETGNVNNYKTVTVELIKDIKGIHDLFLIDENGSSARIKTIAFSGRWDENESESSDIPEEIYILNSLGIADYSFVEAGKLDIPVTRREFSKMASELLKIKATSIAAFRDIDSDDKDLRAMSAVYSLGALELKDGFFRPNDSISIYEACRALIILLGYETKTAEKYKGSYLAQAVELNMNSGINTDSNSKLTHRDAVVLFENTLYVSMPLVEYPSLNIIYENSSERTVLSMIHNVKKSRGVVNGNSKTYLSRYTASTSPSQVLIDDSFYCVGSSGADKYLGYNITFYFKKTDGQNTILAVLPVEDSNIIETVKSDDIKSFSSGSLKYEKNGKEKTISFKNTADILFNGVSCTDYNDSDFILEEGYINFIDNNKDGNYEVVDIVSGIDYVVDTVDIFNEIITLEQTDSMSSRLSVITSQNRIGSLEIYLKGNRSDVCDIKSGDVITVYESKMRDGMTENCVIRVSNEVSEEIIIEKYSASGKNYIITEGGSKYLLSQKCNNNINVGVSYKIHLNESGKAVWLEQGSKRDFKYGYVMNAGLLGDSLDKAFCFKILTEESEIGIFRCAERLIYDGEILSGYSNQSSFISPSGERYEPQIVRYKTNTNGEINFVDTASVGLREDRETSLIKNLRYNSADYKSNYGYFWKTTPIDENTVVFVTPLYYESASEMIDNCDDSDFYATKARQYGGMSTYSEGYDGSFCKPLGAMISYKMNRNDFQETSPVVYITEVSETLDRKGNPTKKITGISRGQIVKLILNEEANEEFGEKMAEGDLWIYNLDLKNEVTFLVPLWSVDGSDYGSAYPLHIRPFDKNNLCIMYAQSINNHNGVYFEADVNGASCGFSFDNASIMIYDKQSGSINSIQPENLITSPQAAENGMNQYAFIYAYQKEVKQVIVVRE